jgi:hypothetical protein
MDVKPESTIGNVAIHGVVTGGCGDIGEWRSSDPSAVSFNFLGLGTLVVAIGVLSIGNRG